jgi:hypothetical protein
MNMVKAKTKKTDLVTRTFYIDMDNYLLLSMNDKLINVKLKLKGDKVRQIGTVTKSTRTIEIRRVRDRHLFRKLNAYGFNDYVLRHQTSFEWIRLSDDVGDHWKIPVSYVLEKGEYLNFKKEGFELQRFVSLNDLEQFRVKKEENRRL